MGIITESAMVVALTTVDAKGSFYLKVIGTNTGVYCQPKGSSSGLKMQSHDTFDPYTSKTWRVVPSLQKIQDHLSYTYLMEA